MTPYWLYRDNSARAFWAEPLSDQAVRRYAATDAQPVTLCVPTVNIQPNRKIQPVGIRPVRTREILALSLSEEVGFC